MTGSMRFWDALKTPPPSALKKITGGRLSGKTDISPQWRLQAMTEVFGPVGIGWRYEIVRTWTETYHEQIGVFAEVHVRLLEDGGENWSAPIPGIGGSMLVEIERSGPHFSDEGYKMAVTDALSVCFKAIGVAADVYLGMMDGKHSRQTASPSAEPVSESAGHSEGGDGGRGSKPANKPLGWAYVQLTKAFGDVPPWESTEKQRVLRTCFGTSDSKKLKAMSEAELKEKMGYPEMIAWNFAMDAANQEGA